MSLGIFGKFTSRIDEFIQILHGNHQWIVVGGKEEENAVEIYDSLANGSTTRKIAHQVCQLQRCNKKQLRASTPDLGQGNGVDCGAFAIAFAVELTFGESPEKKLLEPNSMRSHLSECLKKGEFTLFPSTRRKQRKSKNYLGLLDIYCTC